MFENEETGIIVEKKLLPVLEELARAEFGVYSMNGDVCEETIQWMKRSKSRLQKIAVDYLDGLLQLHISYGGTLQNLSGNLNDSGN